LPIDRPLIVEDVPAFDGLGGGMGLVHDTSWLSPMSLGKPKHTKNSLGT
jgi:hypothetical protein